MNDSLKLLLVDDDAFVRQALKVILKSAHPGATLAEAETLEEALTLVEENEWSLIILDLALGNQSGLAVLHRLSALGRMIPTLVLTSLRETNAARPAFRAGARGFLSKNEAASSSRLKEAVELILNGGKYVSESLAAVLVDDLNKDSHAGADLSSQESRVLLYIASGKSVKEIAHLMAVSEKTVRTYKSRLCKKLDLNSDAELVRYALQHNIVN